MLQTPQEVAPSSVVVSPNLHWTHLVKSLSSSARFHPTGHNEQGIFESSVDAMSMPYLPTIHFEQEDSPGSSVYCPRRQLVQTTAPA